MASAADTAGNPGAAHGALMEGVTMNRNVCLIALLLAVPATPVWAGPKEDVAAATAKWADAVATNDPDAVTALYANDGVLWGTLSPSLRSDQAAIRAYFVSAFRRSASAQDQAVRVYDNTA